MYLLFHNLSNKSLIQVNLKIGKPLVFELCITRTLSPLIPTTMFPLGLIYLLISLNACLVVS